MSQLPRMPEEVKQAYRKYCRYIPGAIVAGGAIRDSLNGVEFKDIDMFVDQQYAPAFQSMIKEWDRLGHKQSKLFKDTTSPWGTPTTATPPIQYGSLSGYVTSSGFKAEASPSSNNPYQNNTKIVEVYERYEFDVPLNLIFLECDPKEYVTKHFDFGICKAWYDGSFVHMHGDYRNDVNNKTITMTLPEARVLELYGSVREGVEQMREHGYRIQRKFPNFKIVMPTV